MAKIKKKSHKKIVEEFEKILRSGKDYTVTSMCNDVGEIVYMECKSVMRIVNEHYQQVISQEMIEFINNLECSREQEIKQFSDKFEVCKRESILLIRYIRRRNE